MTTRALPSHLRNPSLTQSGNATSSATPSLQARIEEKRVELANLRELRDLSGQLANQMQMLEDKVATLSNGTEAVAAVLSNWADVLKAIGLASSKSTGLSSESCQSTFLMLENYG